MRAGAYQSPGPPGPTPVEAVLQCLRQLQFVLGAAHGVVHLGERLLHHPLELVGAGLPAPASPASGSPAIIGNNRRGETWPGALESS